MPMDTKMRDQIVELLAETGRAHDEAFSPSGGDDPDWPIWYADYARDRFAERFGIDYTRSQLVYCLMNADMEHQARAPDTDWQEFYADQFMERCGTSQDPAQDRLTLYHFDACPFCRWVREEISELGIDVELRDIFENTDDRDDLVDARGRTTVPVLRITSPDGDDRWMPESRDIVEYLRQTYG